MDCGGPRDAFDGLPRQSHSMTVVGERITPDRWDVVHRIGLTGHFFVFLGRRGLAIVLEEQGFSHLSLRTVVWVHDSQRAGVFPKAVLYQVKHDGLVERVLSRDSHAGLESARHAVG